MPKMTIYPCGKTSGQLQLKRRRVKWANQMWLQVGLNLVLHINITDR